MCYTSFHMPQLQAEIKLRARMPSPITKNGYQGRPDFQTHTYTTQVDRRLMVAKHCRFIPQNITHLLTTYIVTKCNGSRISVVSKLYYCQLKPTD